MHDQKIQESIHHIDAAYGKSDSHISTNRYPPLQGLEQGYRETPAGWTAMHPID